MRAKLVLPGLASVALLAGQSLPAAKIVLVAGGTNEADHVSIAAKEMRLRSPFGVDFDPSGNMIIVEMTGERVRKVDRSGLLTTIAGTGIRGYSGDGGPGRDAQFAGIHNLAIAPNGDIYLADTWNHCVRKIEGSSGKVATVAGTGKKGFSGDGGPAVKADFGGVYCVSLDPAAQNLYCADLDNRRIRAVNLKTGIVKTVAGNGEKGMPKEGATATQAPLVDPRAVIADAAGNIFVLERGGNALRVVDPGGSIRTVAGTGAKGFSGDNGLASQATLNGPKHLCFDLEGNVLIADTENHVIRKYVRGDGRIVRVAGNGKKGRAGVDGPPEQVEMNQPHGVYVHRDGKLYISDSSNGRVLRVEP
jgi:hypothetical protein